MIRRFIPKITKNNVTMYVGFIYHPLPALYCSLWGSVLVEIKYMIHLSASVNTLYMR